MPLPVAPLIVSALPAVLVEVWVALEMVVGAVALPTESVFEPSVVVLALLPMVSAPVLVPPPSETEKFELSLRLIAPPALVRVQPTCRVAVGGVAPMPIPTRLFVVSMFMIVVEPAAFCT